MACGAISASPLHRQEDQSHDGATDDDYARNRRVAARLVAHHARKRWQEEGQRQRNRAVDADHAGKRMLAEEAAGYHADRWE